MPNQYPEVYTQFLANIIIVSVFIILVVSILFLYQKKRALKDKEIESIKISYEKALLQTQVEIQEEVLKNISMELHDNIGQIMLLANINVTILQKMDLPLKANNLIIDTKKILSTASEDIVELSRSLNSDRIIKIGVFKAIIKDLKQLERKELFKLYVFNNTEENESNLPPATQLMVFRMFQEIIKNIIKHANATSVEFIISKQDELMELKFIDDGVGFEYSSDKMLENYGIGLASLNARAKHFKGSVNIKSILHKGTTISIFIPVSTVC